MFYGLVGSSVTKIPMRRNFFSASLLSVGQRHTIPGSPLVGGGPVKRILSTRIYQITYRCSHACQYPPGKFLSFFLAIEGSGGFSPAAFPGGYLPRPAAPKFIRPTRGPTSCSTENTSQIPGRLLQPPLRERIKAERWTEDRSSTGSGRKKKMGTLRRPQVRQAVAGKTPQNAVPTCGPCASRRPGRQL